MTDYLLFPVVVDYTIKPIAETIYILQGEAISEIINWGPPCSGITQHTQPQHTVVHNT